MTYIYMHNTHYELAFDDNVHGDSVLINDRIGNIDGSGFPGSEFFSFSSMYSYISGY